MAQSSAFSAAAATATALAGTGLASVHPDEMFQVITFDIGTEKFALPILSILEFRQWTKPTPVPLGPDHMVGVINIRGVIVPIFDLRSRFAMGRTEPTDIHVVIIVNVSDRIVGILIDAVSDIEQVSRADVRPIPDVGRIRGVEYLDGLITIKGKMVALLDLEATFGLQVAALNSTLSPAATTVVEA